VTSSTTTAFMGDRGVWLTINDPKHGNSRSAGPDIESELCGSEEVSGYELELRGCRDSFLPPGVRG